MIATEAGLEEYKPQERAHLILDEMKDSQRYLISEFQAMRDGKMLSEIEYADAVIHLRAITDARLALEKYLK